MSFLSKDKSVSRETNQVLNDMGDSEESNTENGKTSSKNRVRSVVDCDNDSEDSTNVMIDNSIPDNPIKSDSDDEIFFKSSSKSRIRNIVDSDEDAEHSTNTEKENSRTNDDLNLSDDSVSKKSYTSLAPKSNKRIRKQLDSSTDDSAGSENEERVVQSSRIEDRRNKFDKKFKNMFAKSKKSKKIEQDIMESNDLGLKAFKSKLSSIIDSGSSDNDGDSKTKKEQNTIKSNAVEFEAVKPKLSNVIDSESSDDDEESKTEELVKKSQGKPKKLYENNDKPKVQRMSAKQAMEQMHKIKSESGRMLREKQVTLPYHRPKQVSLKDMLAKKKINLTPGNKRMGFKMNEDQLKVYAQQLKEREKEMLELCKSESESEEDGNTLGNSKQEDEKSDTNNIPDAVAVNDATNISENKPVEIIEACKNLLEMFQKEENVITANSNDNNTDTIPTVTTESETVDKINYLDFENIPDRVIITNTVAENEVTDMSNEGTANSNSTHEKSLIHIDENSMDVSKLSDDPKSPLKDISVENEDVESDVEMAPADSYEPNSDYEENTELFDARKDFYIAHSKTQSDDVEPTALFQNISCSAPLPNVKPTLTGSPGCFIDLMSGEVQSGVELLKKKYLLHATMKTPEEIEREKERRIQPGSSLLKLKRDLENKMTDHRTQEWTKRAEEMALKKREENDNLSDFEELLEKEKLETNEKDGDVLPENNDEVESESGEESEPEEDDVLIKSDKPKEKCGYLDEEAEVEDDEDAGSDDEDENEHSTSDESSDEQEQAPQEGKRTLTRIIKAFDSDSSDDETQAENKLENNTTLNDSSKLDGNEPEEIGKDSVLSTPLKKDKSLIPTQSEELFQSQEITKNDTNFSLDWEDHLPLGQEPAPPCATPLPLKKNADSFFNEPSDRTGRSDLSSLVSPIIKLTAVQRMSSGNVSVDQTPSPRNALSSPKYKSPHEADKFTNLQKKLLFETESSEPLQDTQDELENLCSGKFPSQNLTSSSCKPVNITLPLTFDINPPRDGAELTQNTENELLELCTGKFAGLNDSAEAALLPNNIFAGGKKENDSQNISLVWSEPQNTETFNDAISTLISEHRRDEADKYIAIKDSTKVTEEDDLASQDAKNVNTLKYNTKSKEKFITSFFKSNNKEECEMLKASLGPVKEIEPSASPINAEKKFYILSTSEDENSEKEEGERKIKNKVLKSRKDRGKKKKQLQISDDEESEVEENNDVNSMVDDEEPDRLVDYDSEENEIEVRPEISESEKPKKKMTSEFFDREAELTSEDEWRASGDEDERGLDRMEREEGDDDQFDQRAMKKQLDRIHLRQILDDDKREVQMLQEMLLEDDMEGGTRERKFRWKNIDGSVEVGAAVGDDDIDGGVFDELQSEEQWRKQRHERETFLRELMEKENLQRPNAASQRSDSSLKGVSRTSFIKSCLVKTQITKYASSIEITSSEAALKSKQQNVNLSTSEEMTNEDSSCATEKKKSIDLPEPVKKPFLMQNNVRGSFLSRGQAAMNRLALLTKNGPQVQDSDEPTNLSSLAPGKKKNFVFATVSPPCNGDSLSEESKMIKRKATSDVSTPKLIKKIKMTEKSTIKSRKSLLDHLE